jgi:hypothetical protein
MLRPSPDEALEQFISDAKANGVSFKQQSTARHFLRQLMGVLRTLSADGAGYRAATEEIGRIIPEENKEAYLMAVRDFFPYWNGDKAIAPAKPKLDLTAPPVAVATPIAAPRSMGASFQTAELPRHFAGAMAQMDEDPWADRDLASLERQVMQWRSLTRYREELVKLGLTESNVALRQRLMKLLLYTMRDESQNTELYRSGVDRMLTLLPHQERWHVFVSLAREFFYFMAGAPDAGSKLQAGISDADMLGLLDV